MTPTQHLIATQAQRLIPEVADLYERALKLEQEHSSGLQRVAVGYHDSARSLLHYLAIRQVDVRQIQMALAAIGLSSLGRMEAHTLSTLHAVLFALHRIANQDCTPKVRSPVNLDTGKMLLARHAEALLGLPAGKRSVRIMVTMPTEAATNPTLVHDLLAAGMDVMRINCAHDGREVWAAMADNLRRARRELGRACKIQTDLGGPKLRTGALQSAGRFLRIKPKRDIRGAVVTPSCVWLTPAETPQAAPAAVANTLQLPREFLQQARRGDVLRFSDTRGKERAARIVASAGESRLVEFTNTAQRRAYLMWWARFRFIAVYPIMSRSLAQNRNTQELWFSTNPKLREIISSSPRQALKSGQLKFIGCPYDLEQHGQGGAKHYSHPPANPALRRP